MMKAESGNSYKNILKGTSIFGGVQIFNILINLIRGKFVAIILGPEGMGISALFTSSSNTIQRLASLGLSQSIVRETAAADDNIPQRNLVISTVSKLIWITSLIGGIVCMALSVPLSRLTFGTSDYAWQFILLGVAVAFGIAATGKLSILQGLHQVKRISKASIIGGATGLFIGVPLYYLFGDKGIVPAIVAVSLSLFIFYTLSLNKCHKRPKLPVTWKEAFPTAKKLLALGIILIASDAIGTLMIYLLNLFIRYFGSTYEVGLYQAANSVTNQYAGLVFAAMAMDYFPRLSKVSDNNSEMTLIVNRQTEIVSFLIAPAMTLLILSAPLIIRVLLSEEFHEIIPLMRWFGVGVLIKALGYPMGYIALAKGNRKIFFLLEGLAGNLLYLICSAIFFYFFGLIGLGYAIVAEQSLMLLVYYIVNSSLYSYRFSIAAGRATLISLLFGILTFLASFIDSVALTYIFMSLCVAMAMLWGFFSIKSKLSVKS